MRTAFKSDTVIRFVSPAMAAEKLGWSLARVLKRRDELGLGPFVGRRVPRSWATASRKPVTSKAEKRERAKRLAASGA